MNYQSSASVAEYRVWTFTQLDIGVSDGHVPGFAVVVDDEILHVASVWSFGIVEAVFLTIGIEMRAGRLEVRGIALGILMNMDGVLTGGHVVKVQPNLDTSAGILDTSATHVSSAAIFHIHFNGARKQREGEQYRNGQNEAIRFHAANYTHKR